ncbi:hypothetical protein MYP_4623 [Sporocytophaga myxococcoides]|uniref:DUF7079 domain-containing protein n=1 Tax=Sporocytophaga myxococcoides TaxID=153721 RepID=A0A098LMQ4_9BACT|nr:hypothetical protein [Sporocytophaga myxococcoides]GAL87393.1 hypothetical protein MYP_4623 [Sporocytophaga myxococcoides]
MIDHQDIEIRTPVWIALSEFYLDTELTNEDFDRIAAIFQNSGLTLKELKEIDLFEVFTFLQPNLLSIAGAWSGFEEEWLLAHCEKRYRRRKNILHRLNCKFWNIFFYWMRRNCWEQIEKRMSII